MLTRQHVRFSQDMLTRHFGPFITRHADKTCCQDTQRRQGKLNLKYQNLTIFVSQDTQQ